MSSSLINNAGDNVVLLDPSSDNYIQLTFNGDSADDPTTYGGFSGTATIVGGVEDWGSDTDGIALARQTDGDIAVGNHSAISANPVLASPGHSNHQVPVVLLINEVDAAGGAAEDMEFVELFGTPELSLDGYVLVLFDGNGVKWNNDFDLDGYSLDTDGFFVLGDPGVPNVDFSPPGYDMQNGADAVALYVGDGADWDAGDSPTDVDLVDALVYDTNDADNVSLLTVLTPGQNQINEDGGGDDEGRSNSRVPDGGEARITTTYVQQTPTPGITNLIPELLEIFEIQGDGSASPYAGLVVITEDNVVTGVGPQGFAMQTPDSRSDGDVDTSDGIYVYTGGTHTVAIGDIVNVTGEVIEFYEMTEFSNSPVVSVQAPSSLVVTPVTFDATRPSMDPDAPSCAIEFECYEGMLVAVAEGTVARGNQENPQHPIAEANIVAYGTRPFREEGITYPGDPRFPEFDGNPEIFEIDPDFLGLPNEVMYGGTKFSATGILGYSWGDYELWPTSLTLTDEVIQPTPVRGNNPEEVSIGSLNLWRLF